MAQTRRYPSAFPSYMTNHSVNGPLERVEEREKAKIARERIVADPEEKKDSSPLFGPPRRVEENEESANVKHVLGDFSKFMTMIDEGKVPGMFGVVRVPGTPTDGKKQYFGSGDESQINERKLGSANVKHKIKPAGGTENCKSNSDRFKQKTNNNMEKIHRKDNKESKPEIKDQPMKARRTSVDRISKIDQEKECAVGKSCAVSGKTPDDRGSKVKKLETRTPIKTDDEKPGTRSEPFHDSLSQKSKLDLPAPSYRSKPTPIQIPLRDSSSNSLIQSPNHSDMKVHNILEIMTKQLPVPPLTGICTPVSKMGSSFPFPSILEKDIPGDTSDRKNILSSDLVMTDEESDDEPENSAPDHGARSGDLPRSRSSSSSSGGSSSDSSNSSDSEHEVFSSNQNWSSAPKSSMLNAVSPSVSSTATFTACCPSDNVASSPPKTVSSKVSERIENLLSERISPKARSDQDETIEEHHTDKDDCSVDIFDTVNEELKNQNFDKLKNATLKVSDKSSLQIVSPVNILSQTVHPDCDIKSKTESDLAMVGSLEVKTELTNCLSVSETRNKQTSNEDIVGGRSKSESLKLKLKTGLNGIRNHTRKKNIRGEEKEKNIKKKDSRAKSEDSNKQKKVKRKRNEKASGRFESKRNHANKEEGTHAAKNFSLTEICTTDGRREFRKARVLSDSHIDEGEEEDSVIDVVGCASPVKKKKSDGSKQGKLVNGRVKNGHHDAPLNVQVLRDEDKEPQSLLVKIDLSLLKRIPKMALDDDKMSVGPIHADVEFSSVPNGSDTKTRKKQLSDDCEEDPGGMYSKRSPGWDSDHPKKRVRRNSDREKAASAHKNRHDQRSVAEQNAEVEEDIKKVHPDSHLHQAKTLKREADKLSDKEAKSRTYVEAIIRFICCGRALEAKEETEPRGCQMYSETTELLRFVLKHVLTKSDDKRLLILCLRIQSLLLHRLYRVKNKQAIKNSQILADHFKATHKNNITSPYTTNNKHASTPSPLSPTPSPAGSVGSVGSSGSNSSVEGNNSSSQNGKQSTHTSSSVTSPVSISISQRLHTMMSQYVSTTSKLVHSIDTWDKADQLSKEYEEFFTRMDSLCGALTFQSSIGHVVNYVKRSLSKLHENDKET